MKPRHKLYSMIALSHALTIRPNRPVKQTVNVAVGSHTFEVNLSDNPKASDTIPIDPRKPLSMINAKLVRHHQAALYRQHFNGLSYRKFEKTIAQLEQKL